MNPPIIEKGKNFFKIIFKKLKMHQPFLFFGAFQNKLQTINRWGLFRGNTTLQAEE